MTESCTRTLTQNHSATTSTPQCGYSSSRTNRRWLGRFVTQDTTKQFGDASRGIGSLFSWVEGRELYLQWTKQKKIGSNTTNFSLNYPPNVSQEGWKHIYFSEPPSCLWFNMNKQLNWLLWNIKHTIKHIFKIPRRRRILKCSCASATCKRQKYFLSFFLNSFQNVQITCGSSSQTCFPTVDP